MLSKENAKEAATELISKKDGIDMVDAEAKIRKSSFVKLWDEHDNMSKGFIDTTEAYGLMQDIAKADEWSLDNNNKTNVFKLNWVTIYYKDKDRET